MERFALMSGVFPGATNHKSQEKNAFEAVNNNLFLQGSTLKLLNAVASGGKAVTFEIIFKQKAQMQKDE